MEGQEFLEWLGHEFPACKSPDDHLPCVVYDRPWRRFFRRRYMVCCWHCPLIIEEPARMRSWPAQHRNGIMARPA